MFLRVTFSPLDEEGLKVVLGDFSLPPGPVWDKLWLLTVEEGIIWPDPPTEGIISIPPLDEGKGAAPVVVALEIDNVGEESFDDLPVEVFVGDSECDGRFRDDPALPVYFLSANLEDIFSRSGACRLFLLELELLPPPVPRPPLDLENFLFELDKEDIESFSDKLLFGPSFGFFEVDEPLFTPPS